MLESLKVLKVESSGLKTSLEKTGFLLEDKELLKKAKGIKDKREQEEFLMDYLKGKPLHDYLECANLLIKITKKDSPEFAIKLLAILQRNAELFAPDYYLSMAQIALESKMYKNSIELLECAVLLCQGEASGLVKKIKKLFEKVHRKQEQEEINVNSKFQQYNNSKKTWLLEQIYYQFGIDTCLKCAFRLLDTFPQNLENYKIIYRILSQEENKEAQEKFSMFISNNENLNPEYKNLYLGLIKFNLNSFDESINLLTKVPNTLENSLAQIYQCYCFLLNDDRRKFEMMLNNISPSSEVEYLGLFFLGGAYLNKQCDPLQDKINTNITVEMSRIIKVLINNNKNDLVDRLLLQFNAFNYKNTISELYINLAEMFIKQNNLEKAQEIIKDLDHVEVHRVKAWIYRIEGRNDLAETELAKYREKPCNNDSLPTQIIYQSKNIETLENLPSNPKEIMKTVENIYNQISRMVAEINLEYGTNSSTCSEYKCGDCCKRTHPLISYTEYLYLKSWLDQQSEELKTSIYDKSKDFVQMFKKRYGKEPPFIVSNASQNNNQYYSSKSLNFDCPCLKDDICTVYEARPFMCRAFSYSFTPGIAKLKGCGYFMTQFNVASFVNRIRKVINCSSVESLFGKIDEILIGDKVLAPIPVWLAQSHNETLLMVKNIKHSTGLFKPLFNLIAKFQNKK